MPISICLLRGTVEDVQGNDIVLYIDRTSSDKLPYTGRLTIDIWAAKEALSIQRPALDAVRFDRAVRADLRRLLIHPEVSAPPGDIGAVEFIQPGLDDAKRAAVAKGLGTQDILLVQGPPGTGKTTFITELILQTLSGNSNARILLTSQTHVALDNAVERLCKIDANIRIVRIGSVDNVRISEMV